MGCRALWGVLQSPRLWDMAGYVGCCELLWAARVGYCVACDRICGSLVLSHEGHAGSSVTPIQPFG